MAQLCALLISTVIILVIVSYQTTIIAYSQTVNGIPSSNNIPSNKTTTIKPTPTAADSGHKPKAPKPKKTCPDPCSCPSEDTIDCSGKKLSSIPQIDSAVAANIKFLNLSDNALDDFDTDAKSYSSYKKLKLEKLDISRNKLQTISFKKFNFTVVELDMSYNNLSNFLTNLTTGSVVQSLERLKLNNNFLTTFPDKFFDLFANLISLDISNNPIKSIPEHSFELMRKLEFLNLSSLQLTELKGNQFHGVDQLKTLDLSNNQFSRIPNTALIGASNLQKLIFSSNPIKALGEHDLYLVKSLRHLEIENCTRLEKVDAEAFESLRDIETIIISQNPNLSKINPLAFKNNTSPPLKTFDLSSNKLSTLDQLSLKWETIDNINLSQNPWHCDCEISWLKTLSSIGNIHCASPEIYKDIDVTLAHPDCTPKPTRGSIPLETKITLIVLFLLAVSILFGSMVAIKHNSFCRRLLGREQYSSVYYTKAEFGPMDAL